MLSPNSNSHCGWWGSVKSFLEEPRGRWLDSLRAHHKRCMLQEASSSQIEAWKSSYTVLVESLRSIIADNKQVNIKGIIFEYELPRERGRRPDAILLSNKQLLILEFKEAAAQSQAYVDQVAAYARDLKNYHAASHDLNVIPILVMVSVNQITENKDGVIIVSGDQLRNLLKEIIRNDDQEPDIHSWIHADYDPLPNIISAARSLFNHEPLPNIRRAQSAGIPQTLHTLLTIAERARTNRERHLAIVTGVPGSGKTLAGLQLVYSDSLGNVEVRERAVFLSGNGPLVEVLQHALKNKVFVQDVHGFLKQYGGDNKQTPSERIWIYDEAQRAWDANKVGAKRGSRVSEPEDFLRIGDRIDDWVFMVGLVGEGQEIHVGEEAGIEQWNDAIKQMTKKWIVHCPPKLKEIFSSASEVIVHSELDLTVSLRSHLAEDVQAWVTNLLIGEIELANSFSKHIRDQGFDMYLTRDLKRAKEYVQARYANNLDKRYGLIASSKARDLEFFGVRNDYFSTRKVQNGPWYNNDPSDKRSCCSVEEVVTEFGCQGLELDFPILCWGSDMIWERNTWRTPISKINAQNPRLLRLNSYRVLLTRGRDGFVIFVPGVHRYEPTVEILKLAGVLELNS